jgi:hypothetical protein
MELTSTHEQLQQIFKNPKVSAKEVTSGILQCVGSAQNSDNLELLKVVMNKHHAHTVKATRKRALILLDKGGFLTPSPEDLKLPRVIQKAIAGREKYLSNQTQQPVVPQPDQGNDIGGSDQGVSDPTLLEIPAKRARRTPVPQSTNTGGDSSGSVEVSPPSAESAALISELACLFEVEAARIEKVRKQGALYSLIDIAMLVTQKSKRYTGEIIREVVAKYPEVDGKIVHLKFTGVGRGQKNTPVGDIYTVTELIMLLPGKKAALVRSKAARLFVRYYGGDYSLVDEVIQHRERQDDLRRTDPLHPARTMGEEVEAESGGTAQQALDLEKRLMERHVELDKEDRKSTSYNPMHMSAEDHNHKDAMVDLWINGIEKVTGCKLANVSGSLAMLDDFGREAGIPRVASMLKNAGLQTHLIVSPNKEESVVTALRNFGVHSVKNDFTRALDDDFADLLLMTPLVGGYVDSTSGSPHALQSMIDVVRSKSKRGPLAVAYTIVERDFTPGGSHAFVKRVLEMCDFMTGHDFKPQMGELSRSYFEPKRANGRRAGTSFWVRDGAVCRSE